MASGAPVIAYGKGGALDTVIHNRTGILFEEQTNEAFEEAVTAFVSGQYVFDPAVMRSHAERFDKSEFQRTFKEAVDRAWVSSRASSDPAMLPT